MEGGESRKDERTGGKTSQKSMPLKSMRKGSPGTTPKRRNGTMTQREAVENQEKCAGCVTRLDTGGITVQLR